MHSFCACFLHDSRCIYSTVGVHLMVAFLKQDMSSYRSFIRGYNHSWRIICTLDLSELSGVSPTELIDFPEAQEELSFTRTFPQRSVPPKIGYGKKCSVRSLLVRADIFNTHQISHLLMENYKCDRCTTCKQF